MGILSVVHLLLFTIFFTPGNTSKKLNASEHMTCGSRY